MNSVALPRLLPDLLRDAQDAAVTPGVDGDRIEPLWATATALVAACLTIAFALPV